MAKTSEDGNWIIYGLEDPAPHWPGRASLRCLRCGALIDTPFVTTHNHWHEVNDVDGKLSQR